MVNKQVYQFTCLPFGLATSPCEFTKLLRPVVALLRQRGVKLQVSLDDWLIGSDTQLQAQTTISVLQLLGWIINYEKSDLTPKSGLPVHRDAVQHSTIHSGTPTEDASQSPVCSPTLDDQPRHHSPRSAQIAGHAGVYGFAGTTGKTPSSSGPVVGRHKHGARGSGAGPTGSQFFSGYCQRWPGGQLQQSYKVFRSPARKRK